MREPKPREGLPSGEFHPAWLRRVSVLKGRRLRLGYPEGLSAVFTGGIGPGPEGSRLTPDVRRFQGSGEEELGRASPRKVGRPEARPPFTSPFTIFSSWCITKTSNAHPNCF